MSKKKRSKRYGDRFGSKKKQEMKHARMRAYQRYGIEFDSDMRLRTLGNIKSGNGTFMLKQSNRMSLWKNVVPEHPDIVIAYDSVRHEVVTFLRPEWFAETPVEA